MEESKGLNIEYNSQREFLIIPEYGRNVQKLIRYARAIEDREERTAYLESIIDLMMQMHPQNKNLDDYRDKLWRQVFKIGNYDLDIVPASGYIPTPEDEIKNLEPINYPPPPPKFRHYGNNVQQLVKKALEMEEGPIRDGFVSVIGSYMKLAYRTWNKEHYVSDDIIKTDLESLSNGKLVLDDEMTIENLSMNRRNNNGGRRSTRNNRDSRNNDRRRRRRK